ncbi:MAG: LysM peptidoglycan-binding domain-containing protein [Planctomycetota bacterium]
MTRETKIGLLVGLAFLLVVGILLSDHVSSAARPPEAPLETAANDVAAALSAPDNDDVAPIFEMRQPDTLVAASVPQDEQEPSHFAMAPIYDADAAPLARHESPREDAWDTFVPDAENVEPEPEPTPTNVVEEGGLVTESVAVQEYTVKKGDSLSKLAHTFLGADTPENREIIIALNPSLRKNPDKLLLGVTYQVPAGGAKPTTIKPSIKPREVAPTPAIDGEVYEVQPGDSLWRIADRVCGDASLVDEIMELNADVLGGKDIVKVGMKLRLP